MNKDKLVDAFNEIDPEYINSARDRIGYGGREKPKKTLHVFRTVLIAAVITALMVGTAYAADLFGLKSRSIPAEASPVLEALTPSGRKTIQRSYLSLNGIAGSNEYHATAEWENFRRAYEEQKEQECAANGQSPGSWFDWDFRFAESESDKEVCFIYHVGDETMFQKLLEIAGKYQLTLLTNRNDAVSLASLRKLSGVGMYSLSGDFSSAYVFEDGSFKAEGVLTVAQSTYLYELHRIESGALYPYSSAILDDMLCEEWQYTAADGSIVDMALFDTTEFDQCSTDSGEYPISSYRLLIMYDDGTSFVTVYSSWNRYEPGTEEEARLYGYASMEEAAQKNPDPYTIAEAIADSFDYAALLENEPSVSTVLALDRRAESNPEAAENLARILDSAEYKANLEYQEAYKNLRSSFDSSTINFEGISFLDEAILFNYRDQVSFAGEARAAMQAAADKYSLTMPDTYQDVCICDDEALAALGQGRLIDSSSRNYLLISYDTGAFSLYKTESLSYSMHYIPKGSFFGGLCIWNFPGAEDYTKVWPYETLSGATVCCAAYGDYDYGVVVYETENAYVFLTGVSGVTALEGTADEVDFTQFK